jgi:tRNA-2-methylthio-N6-dimethylallyladenosine synthase
LLQQQDEFNDAAIGKTMDVLFEKPGRGPGQYVGRSPWLHPVHAEGKDLIGKILPVKIVARTSNSLKGALA